MKINIIDKKDSRLFKRIEIIADVVFEGPTPSRSEIKSELSKLLSVKEDLIVVKKVERLFGVEEARISAFIYDDADAIKEFEQDYILKRGGSAKGDVKTDNAQEQGSEAKKPDEAKQKAEAEKGEADKESDNKGDDKEAKAGKESINPGKKEEKEKDSN